MAQTDSLQRVRDSFALQGAMSTLGAQLTHLAPGAVDISFDWAPGLTQQHGFIHAGMLSAALDSACGYAGFSLMPEDAGVLTIEFKINLLAPAQGQRFRCEGRVLKPGRTIVLAEGRAFAIDGGQEKLCATMHCTLMAVQGRPGIAGK
ncbi:PaaI family thioesterase [Comamonas aquatica]|uniref:Medium/long-chain acyl-CoA thioesterase YigI n=1 Tax=Comamonas aquatica TaxID=225991 RepID=A0AA42W337_9BURK|nr:PaaI family thioesterase [Comamonas aquatica]MDH0494534.1 PaaI family thioesterase [Comamonas aquatica]MDH1427187.1 PaaI family thioesterase [Comamonas aquatica]MDH1605653.1 PaaI family thioesterase [Comamonas aquatica]MDH1617644.1 PaaI family thioesterase [Comamonas aquatica]MDH1674246.1 PaaI family thioesterase [Comamonas aquatica]